MTYVIVAAALLVTAVAILTLPWSRRNPADLSAVELGYVWRGPRGAMIGALRTLLDAGVAQRSRLRGIKRTDKPLPHQLDPLTRAVFNGIGEPRGPTALLELPGVQEKLAPVAERVIGARLRVGTLRRLLGTAAAAAVPMIALVTLVRGDVLTGIAVAVVGVVVAGWLVRLRGMTIAGARTLAAAPSRTTSALPRGRGRTAGLNRVPLVLDWDWEDVITADYGSGGNSGSDSSNY